MASQVEPGYLRPRLPRSAPEEGDDGGRGGAAAAAAAAATAAAGSSTFSTSSAGFNSFLSDVETHILPGLTHWQSPNFFSYYPANSSLPGILGEMLCAAFNVIGFSWAGSPAATELEGVVLDWLAEAMGLPACFYSPEANSESVGGGCIQSTASDAALVALLAARARALAPLKEEEEEDELPPPPGSHNEDTDNASKLTVYTSEQAHCCVKKACMVAGIPFSRVREIAAPEENGFEIDADALRRAIEEDLEQGLVPCLVVATVGTTPSCAVDDLRAVADAMDAAFEKKEKNLPRRRKPWLHVDAAFAGVASLCEEYRDILNGAERCDSLSTNFHKW